MPTVQIGSVIANEYVSRCVFEGVPREVGVHYVEPETAREMLADAEFYCDRWGPDETPANIKAAYRRLKDQLTKLLK